MDLTWYLVACFFPRSSKAFTDAQKRACNIPVRWQILLAQFYNWE